MVSNLTKKVFSDSFFAHKDLLHKGKWEIFHTFVKIWPWVPKREFSYFTSSWTIRCLWSIAWKSVKHRRRSHHGDCSFRTSSWLGSPRLKYLSSIFHHLMFLMKIFIFTSWWMNAREVTPSKSDVSPKKNH